MSFDSIGIASELLTNEKSARPDHVADFYADRRIGLEIRLLKGGDGDEGLPLVVIEGTRVALLFLADLLLARTRSPRLWITELPRMAQGVCISARIASAGSTYMFYHVRIHRSSVLESV